MAAGLGFKTFATGEVLTAADTNGYLMQGILVFASAAARDAAITSPQEGQFAYLKDTNVTTYYTGSAWANVDTTGMTNPMTTTGDTIYSSSGSTPARLGIGSTGNVLTVSGGLPTWAAPSAGTKGLNCIQAETAFSAVSSVTLDNIFSSSYTNYRIMWKYYTSTTFNLVMNFRAGGTNASTNYNSQRQIIFNTTQTIDRQLSQTAFSIAMDTNSNAFNSLSIIDISSVALAEATAFTVTNSCNYGAADPQIINYYGNHSTATAYDGFRVTVGSGNFTGSYSVYGYSKVV
jgi:hypothetical protein